MFLGSKQESKGFWTEWSWLTYILQLQPANMRASKFMSRNCQAFENA